jgi:hypothetical protein
MDGKILDEFDIEAPKLVYAVASRPFVLKYKGKSAWDKLYKNLCNSVRISCRLGNKAVCLSTLSSKVDGMLCFDTLHVTVLDYDIDDDESFFIKGNLETGEFSIRDDDPDEEFLTGDDKMSQNILQPIRQTKIVDPYTVQLLLSEPYVIARKGPYGWSEKYVKACLAIQDRLGEEEAVEWYNGMVIIGVICDEDGIVDYKNVNVCQFNQELHSHMNYSINQDGTGAMQLVLLEDDEEGTVDV